MFKKAIRLLVIIIITMMVSLSLFHLLLTGSPYPLVVIEKLNNPQEVTSINNSGLITKDGKLLKIKYISEIPTNSKVVQDAVKYGVEIDENGNAFGLLKIHHWCGNDPVRYQLARINLSGLIIYFGGKLDENISPKILDGFEMKDNNFRYNENGLNVIALIQLNQILRIIEQY